MWYESEVGMVLGGRVVRVVRAVQSSTRTSVGSLAARQQPSTNFKPAWNRMQAKRGRSHLGIDFGRDCHLFQRNSKEELMRIVVAWILGLVLFAGPVVARSAGG